MPDTRPRIVFNAEGVCNACEWHFGDKTKVDWNSRKSEFLDLVRSMKRHPAYDCIVPFSGGKDSASIAWRLKFELGLNPLLVTYGQLLWTDVGKWNFDQVCKAGFDIFYWRVNQDVSRKLAKRFLVERGHPKQHYDSGVNTVPLLTAKSFGIPLVVYAEHGETEYGGLVLSEEHRRSRDITEVLENQVGDHAGNWVGEGVAQKDLWPYVYPESAEGLKAVYFSYFFPWDIYENSILSRAKMNFRVAENNVPQEFKWWGKSDGSFEGFDSIDDMIDDLDFYMMWVKFGFGRATRMASRLIQYGHITREQGMRWVEKYDGEFPETYLPQVLDYLGMTRAELDDAIAKHWNENAHP